jgi:O-antigen ligase
MLRHASRLEGVFILFSSLLLGVTTLTLASMETRWLVFFAAGVLLCVAAAVFGFDRIMTIAFVVGLSVDAHYYLTTPPPVLMWTGTTTPGALSIPLALVPGLLLLGRRIALNRLTGARLDWGLDISIPLGWYFAASLIAILLSSFWFPGLCVIWQGVMLFLLFLIMLNVVRSRQDASTVVHLLLIVLLGQCFVFILQIGLGISFNAVGKVQQIATEGTVWHSASGTAAATTAGFAMFLDPLVMLAYVLFRTVPASGRRTLYGALFLLGATVLALTLNRSTWLAFPLGIGLAERLLRRRGLVSVSGETHRRRGLTIAPVIVLVIFVLVAPMFQSVRKSNHEEDLQQRFDLMKPAMAMIVRHPVFGIGPGSYGFLLREYAVASGYQGWLYIAHNDYLLIWAERGTVALLVWILFLRAAGREFLATSRRPHPWDAAVGVGALSGFAMQLWEVFWTSSMGFSAYGVMYVVLGVCAALNRHVGLPASAATRASTPDAELSADRRADVMAIVAARSA